MWKKLSLQNWIIQPHKMAHHAEETRRTDPSHRRPNRRRRRGIQDLITCATFGDDRLRSLGVARGQISGFPIDLLRHPYHTTVRVCDGISDPAVWCSAMWCGGVLVVSSSPLWRESWRDPLGIYVIIRTCNVLKKGQATWLDYFSEFGLSRYPLDLVISNKLVPFYT